jgi:hypothetical protein
MFVAGYFPGHTCSSCGLNTGKTHQKRVFGKKSKKKLSLVHWKPDALSPAFPSTKYGTLTGAALPLPTFER